MVMLFVNESSNPTNIELIFSIIALGISLISLGCTLFTYLKSRFKIGLTYKYFSPLTPQYGIIIHAIFSNCSSNAITIYAINFVQGNTFQASNNQKEFIPITLQPFESKTVDLTFYFEDNTGILGQCPVQLFAYTSRGDCYCFFKINEENKTKMIILKKTHNNGH